MKKRERRRYLTERYRDRQMRLRYELSGDRRRPFDFERRPRTDFAMKHAFISMLKGDYIVAEWQWGIDSPPPLTAEQFGRLRRHSFDDCGKARCPMCSNPRHNGFGTKKMRLTIHELVAEQRMQDDLYEYWETRGERQDDY